MHIHIVKPSVSAFLGGILGLNIGITFCVGVFSFPKIGTDSEGIKILIQFPENSILKFLFGLCEKFVGGCPPSQTPTQTVKRRFPAFCSQEIGSSLVSFQMIFEALQSQPVRFNFHLLRSKLQKSRNSTHEFLEKLSPLWVQIGHI